MIKDNLVKFYNDLNQFDESQPIAVTFENNELVFRQYNKILMAGIINLYYYPKPKFKFGVLTQNGFAKLREQLIKIIQDERLITEDLLIVPGILSFSAYVYFKDQRLTGPQEIYKCTLCNITNKLYCKYIMNHYSKESKLTYKLIQSELSKK